MPPQKTGHENYQEQPQRRSKLALSLNMLKAMRAMIVTIILVALAITLSVAVAYWMSGLTGQYTPF